MKILKTDRYLNESAASAQLPIALENAIKHVVKRGEYTERAIRSRIKSYIDNRIFEIKELERIHQEYAVDFILLIMITKASQYGKYYKEFNAIFYQKKGLAEQFVSQLNSLVKELETKLNAAFGTNISFKTKWYKANDGIETPRFFIEDTSNTIKFVENDVDALDDIELRVKSSSVKLLSKLVKAITIRYRRERAYVTLYTDKVVVLKYDTYYDMQDLPRVVNEYVDANGFANESADEGIQSDKAARVLTNFVRSRFGIIANASKAEINGDKITIKFRTWPQFAEDNSLLRLMFKKLELADITATTGKDFIIFSKFKINAVDFDNNKVSINLNFSAAYDTATNKWDLTE